MRRRSKNPIHRWFTDETYVKVGEQWDYYWCSAADSEELTTLATGTPTTPLLMPFYPTGAQT